MFIKVKELELRKLEFNELLQPGVIDLGPDITQTVPVLAEGRAELVRENRGARQSVEDIRLVGKLSTEIPICQNPAPIIFVL